MRSRGGTSSSQMTSPSVIITLILVFLLLVASLWMTTGPRGRARAESSTVHWALSQGRPISTSQVSADAGAGVAPLLR